MKTSRGTVCLQEGRLRWRSMRTSKKRVLPNKEGGSNGSASGMPGHVQMTVQSAWHTLQRAIDGEVSLYMKDIFTLKYWSF